jgi:hypothetical protein
MGLAMVATVRATIAHLETLAKRRSNRDDASAKSGSTEPENPIEAGQSSRR